MLKAAFNMRHPPARPGSWVAARLLLCSALYSL